MFPFPTLHQDTAYYACMLVCMHTYTRTHAYVHMRVHEVRMCIHTSPRLENARNALVIILYYSIAYVLHTVTNYTLQLQLSYVTLYYTIGNLTLLTHNNINDINATNSSTTITGWRTRGTHCCCAWVRSASSANSGRALRNYYYYY